MKFLEKIKPHLTSDDFLIQRTVLHALKDYPSVPQEWTITLLKEAFQNLGEKKSILVNIDNFAFNDEALELLIDHLPKMDIMKIHLVLRLLNQIEPALVLKYRNELSNYIPTETWALYELIVNGPEETVRSEYKKAVSDLEKLKYHESAPYNRAKILAACLVRKGWITEAEIAQVMEKDLKDPYFSYEGILSVYMVGLLKLEKYIPTLADLLDRDDDILLVETAASLIQLQSDEVIVAISPYLMKTESVIFASTVAENIKTDLAVQVLREAYHVAETIDDQDIIIEALCHQLSKEAFPEIKDHMEKGKFSTIVDMEETAYGFFRIMGEDHPNLEKWKQAAIKREMHYKEVERYGSILQTVQNEKKVGRNDPCPCCSSKKYKKCCGK